MTQAASSSSSILQLPSFRILWLAQFVSVFGDFVALFGVISLIAFRMHGNAAQVIWAMTSYVTPIAVAGPFSGVLVDRWNAKSVMIMSDVLRAVLVMLLPFVTGLNQIVIVFILLSTVSSFFGPAQSVVLRAVVPAENLVGANVLMTQAFYAVRLIAPAIAGVLVAYLTERSCFYLDSVSFLYSAGMIWRLAYKSTPGGTQLSVRASMQDFAAGNKFIFNHSMLTFAFSAMAVSAFILSSFSPLISIYIRDSLSGGSFLFGIITTFTGLGLLCGAQLVNMLARKRSHVHIVSAGLFLLGAGVGLLGLFNNLIAASVATLTMGAAISFILVPTQTLSQQETPAGMMGRVSSTLFSLMSLAQVLGLLLSGYLAHELEIRSVFLVCAVTLILFANLGYLLTRRQMVAPAGQGVH